MNLLANLKKAVLVLSALLILGLPATAAQYEIDTAHSSVQFQIKHMAISKVKGSFTDFTGIIEFDPANPGALAVESVIQMTSVDTGNEKRDEHLRNEDFFNVPEYPTMTFKSTSVKMDGSDEGVVVGDLTMHGVTQSVELELEINGTITDPWGNERVGASLTGKIDRTDWGLNWSKTMEAGSLMVGHDVKLSLEIEAIKKK